MYAYNRDVWINVWVDIWANVWADVEIYIWVNVYAYNRDVDLATVEYAANVRDNVRDSWDNLEGIGNGVARADREGNVALGLCLLIQHLGEDVNGALEGGGVDFGKNSVVETSNTGNIDGDVKTRNVESAGVHGRSSCESSKAGNDGGRGTHLGVDY